MGYIYILTNPSFEQYVKIGFANDVEKRLEELNKSTAVPFAFRVYATYEVDSRLSDKKLHSILDKLNPELRTVEEINGKKRMREFYAMTPEDAYAILEAISEINGYRDKLIKWKETDEEKQSAKIAKAINEKHQEKLKAFTFSSCGINVGEEIEYYDNKKRESTIFCTVVDDRRVKYNGEVWSMTALAKYLKGVNYELAGTHFFRYKGEFLNELRDRLNALSDKKQGDV